ncbi:MAG TPA: LCP family protein [Candidatus Saccharibacteria bacterium]|nr:LCP family protein [Candidatus Saccharibacteria bacterium]
MSKKQSIDGFVTRSAPTTSTQTHRKLSNTASVRPSLHTGGEKRVSSISSTPTQTTLGRTNIREALQSLDDEPTPPKTSRRQRRQLRRDGVHHRSKKRRIIKWVVITILTVVLGIIAYTGIIAFITTNKMFDGGFFGLTQKQALKEDANGRSNFLIFGTAEDDEGGEHGGANLTDSLMVMSVNQKTKDVFMVSIPRDLWVEYGTACNAGYQGKVNEVYGCYSEGGTDEKAGAAALQNKIGSILGLDIQYYVHLNFTAVVELVDAVGGVDVTIESNPKGVGILDRNFDWKCGYRCYYVKYEDGQQVHLDGEHALALSRARNASGGYGLADSNFDREKNQQKIIKALRKKALSAGTLTNLGKVTSIMNALGNNLRTNIDTKEIQTLMSIANEVSDSAIKSLTFVDEEAPLVATCSIGASSAVCPTEGRYSYMAIQSYIKKNSVNNPVTKEGAHIVVLNGTGTSGVAKTEADVLTAKGYTISAYDNAPDGTYGAVEIYKLGEGNSATTEALKQYYSVQTVKTAAPPVAVDDDVSFVIVIGKVRS